MARFERYANSDDTYSYIVESDKGTDRKYFSENKDEKAEEKARSYYLYLQQLDAQRRNVEQNDQIIAG